MAGMASTEATVAAPGEGKGAEANEPAARPPRRRRRPLLSELAFPGCDRIPMTLAEYRGCEHPPELWDAASRTAWRVREGPTWVHEGPSQTLAEMAALIAAARGSPIKCYGNMGLVQCYEAGTKRLVLHPDQTVYLHPSQVEQDFEDPLLVVGRSFPDVVLEVAPTSTTFSPASGPPVLPTGPSLKAPPSTASGMACGPSVTPTGDASWGDLASVD